VRVVGVATTALLLALLALSAFAATGARAAFTGLGFDACAAPSSAAMTAWLKSPYRAVGIYVGGVNRGCSQPNLPAAWIDAQAAAGWKFIPTYVGLQAPGGSCGSCKEIDPDRAAAQGRAEAKDAASKMQALGLGPGNPIYFDMEHYKRGGSNTLTALAFLGAWTKQLHAEGYVSGVYSSASSGIRDLVDAYGTGFLEPDAIWIANWNKQKTVSDPYVPDTHWANQQRIHQYQGGHKEKHGGVTINIDSNYLDGPVAPQSALPKVRRRPAVKVHSRKQRSLIVSSGKWSGLTPIAYTYQWSRCNKRAGACRTIGGATSTVYRPSRSDVGRRLKVIVTATNALGSRRAKAVTRTVKRNRLP
jgi:hypothetical protein